MSSPEKEITIKLTGRIDSDNADLIDHEIRHSGNERPKSREKIRYWGDRLSEVLSRTDTLLFESEVAGND